MENNNYVFDWNDEINNEDAFVLLPEGDYEFTVTNFERAHFDGSEKLPACNKAIVTFTILGAQDTTTVTEHFLLCSQLEWKISALFLSVGMKKHGEPLRMNWNALTGKKGRCRIFVDNYKKKDGTEGEMLPKSWTMWYNKNIPKKSNERGALLCPEESQINGTHRNLRSW